MHILTSRRSALTTLAVLAVTACALLGLDGFGKGSRVTGRAGTLQDGNMVRELVDDPTEAYRVWKKRGYRGRTAVFVADRWESFDPGELIAAQMYRAYPLKLYNSAQLLEARHLDPVTFLYVASMNNMLRGVVAVLPEAEVERMRQLAPGVKDSRAGSRGVFLSRQGFPRRFCSGGNFGNFAAVSEPVLLYVGASYFRSAEPEELYRQLISAGLETDCVVLCRELQKREVGGGERAKLERFARLLGNSPPPAGAATPGGAAAHPGRVPAS